MDQFSSEVKSVPNFFEFSPFHIPQQAQLLYNIDFAFDYSMGTHECLLSGSVGSAKSLSMAHIGIKHCLMYPKARVIIGRLTLPDLKKTLFATILEHLESSQLKDGKDYFYRETTAELWFSNGSEFMPVFWSDKRWTRIRSINASAALIEELTESDDDHKKGFFEIKQRVGRLPHIREKWIVAATNPAGPAHWAYKYFIKGDSPTRHVIYSRTEDNIFLPREYIEQLKQDLDPKEARRQIYGEWIEIDSERIYHSYDSDKQFLKTDYTINPKIPIIISFDFNIGEGKPMSACVMQYENNQFHVFDEALVHGGRTNDLLEDLLGKGYIDPKYRLIIHGDATGKARDTRSILSDYDLIKKFLANNPLQQFEIKVPLANPPIRKRHNIVNAYCLNEKNQTRLWVYPKAKNVDEALRLTALKKGSDMIEDDSKPYQHVGTALGYAITYQHSLRNAKPIGSQKVR